MDKVSSPVSRPIDHPVSVALTSAVVVANSPGGAADALLLLEDGTAILLEDGSGVLLLEG